MKKPLSFQFLFLLLGLLLGSAREAWASHLWGGDITYVSLGNNQYRVKFRLYRDCSGLVPGPNDFLLSCRNGGCNATATVTAQLVQQGPAETATPFCTALSAGPCQGPAGLANYDVYLCVATVTLPPGNWTLSTFSNSRPVTANAIGGDLYVEATLDNRNQGTTAAANNSPQFDPQDALVQFACRNQPTTIAFPCTEADGDSLAYTLAAPLRACGTPVTYTNYPTPAVPVVLSTNPLCVFNYTGSGGQYSPTYPITLGVDTVGFCPAFVGMPRTFSFNQRARSVTFTPGVFDAMAAPSSGSNKYQIAMLITEYRRINGVRRVIGTVRREATIIVIDCAGNFPPNPPAVSTQAVGCTFSNGPDTVRIDVRACSYARVQLNISDPNNLRTPSANQPLTVSVPADLSTNPLLLGGGDVGTFSLVGNGTPAPRGTFYLQPAPAAVGRTVYFTLRVDDNVCPYPGRRSQVVAIRVFRGYTALITNPAMGAGPMTICRGSSLALSGVVVRPDSVRNLAMGTTLRQTYAYQWSTSSGGDGLPAVTTTPSISVNPTLTTRYFLRITPNVTFWPGGVKTPPPYWCGCYRGRPRPLFRVAARSSPAAP
ncbi:hypothetical protein MUN81_20735 [Hymenobacter sp. 5317J-9]|uniref:hypothetical protein n=1 Tax=Hymenobacter sp. 5317J-9 TaxID=2932250 RepID=UPI001FD6D367|nr:hypothetical protein [Hymenobacter sp. 5317J-9]UOQ97644.1 hypothetical protein MUN81_20735 [Hymenobacter sp. 5317J-9]